MSCFSVEGSSYLQSSALFRAAVDHASDPLLTTDCERKFANIVSAVSTCCSNVKDSCAQVSDGGISDSSSVPLIVLRRTNPKRAAASRNNQTDTRPNCLARKRNSVSKYNKAADVITSFSNITDKMNKVRRKRSCFDRMTWESAWGETGSLVMHFKENNEPAASDFHRAQIQKILKISQCCRARRQTQMVHGDRNTRSPDTQCSFSSHSMHLKNQMSASKVY